MQKIAVTLLLLGWITAQTLAQCPGAPLTLSTQTQVNNFPTNYPNCHVMGVSLTIQGNNITNLNGLSGLNSITKSLFIQNCPALTSLDGLTNLTNISVELTLDNNDALTDLSGLENLPFIGGSLTITGNALLNSLDALSSVAYVNGTLQVSSNPALTDLSGLNNVAFCGRFLQISNNNGLTALNSLNGLTEVGNNAATNGRYLSIASNPNLTTLNGLHNLQSVGTDFEITNNGNLVTLNAFENLETIGGIFAITGNTDLTSVTDFASITSIGGSLTISNNNVLTDCAAQGICDYLAGPGNATISNNDPGCNTVAQVEAECAVLPVELVEFSARNTPDGVDLCWKTATEKENAYFEVQHAGSSDNVFEVIGRIDGQGTTSGAHKYSLTHRQPAGGLNYYRLRQVDFDGTFGYSRIVRVEVPRDTEIEVFPNPTTDLVFLRGFQPECRAKLTTFTGDILQEKDLTEGVYFNLSEQPDGIYFLEIQTGSRYEIRRVVKN